MAICSCSLRIQKDNLMPSRISRRNFLAGLGVAAASTAVSSVPAWSFFEPPLYPPLDLSYFDKPISPAPAEIRLGYASITSGGNDRQALYDFSAPAFRGIQLRAHEIKEFGSANEPQDLLQKHPRTIVALSSGRV